MDSHGRTIAKTLSWRIVAFLITAGIVWAFTGELGFATTIGVADTLIKLGLYYAHERGWNHIRFGRAKSPEYQI